MYIYNVMCMYNIQSNVVYVPPQCVSSSGSVSTDEGVPSLPDLGFHCNARASFSLRPPARQALMQNDIKQRANAEQNQYS